MTSFNDRSASTANFCSSFKIKLPRWTHKLSETLSFALRVLVEAIVSTLIWNWRHQFQLWCVKIVNTRQTFWQLPIVFKSIRIFRPWGGGEFERVRYKRECSPSFSRLSPSFPSARSLASVSPSLFSWFRPPPSTEWKGTASTLLFLDNLEVAMSSDMTSLKQKQEIVLQKLSKANRTVRNTDYTIMLSAYGVDNKWRS